MPEYVHLRFSLLEEGVRQVEDDVGSVCCEREMNVVSRCNISVMGVGGGGF